MPLEEIIYQTSYLKNGKMLNGRFPITINGDINCNLNTGMTKEERDQILSEKPDPSYYLQRQFLLTAAGNYYYQSVDNGGDFLLFF